MNRKIAAGLTALTIASCLLGGCKKEEPQKAQAPETTPAAPAPTTTTPAAPSGTTTPAAQGKSGEALFKERCASCHPDGGNTMNPKSTLHSADLKAHNISTPEDIVKFMRNPPAGMPKFDAAAVPDSDAMAIADYILKTFK